MQTRKPLILTFARVWYSEFYPKLVSEEYTLVHAVVSRKEKAEVLKRGGIVAGCFEEEFDALEILDFSELGLRAYSADRSNNSLTLHDRDEFIGKACAFWDRIFKTSSFDFVLHETIAIEHDEILCKYAEKYGVVDLNYITSIFPNSFYWKESPYHTSLSKERLEGIQPSQKALIKAELYYNETRAKGHEPEYVRRNKWKKVHKTNPLRLAYLFAKYFLSIRRQELKKRSYENVKKDAIFNYKHQLGKRDYMERWMDLLAESIHSYDTMEEVEKLKAMVVFPLHFEPEATLAYFGNDVVHQVQLIQEICDNLPKGYVLVVKEHPQQVGMLLRNRFFDLRKRNSNLMYLAGHHHSNTLIQKSKAVVTFVSSVGWEAALREIPTICFGNVFYDKHPNVLKIKNREDLKKLDAIIADYVPVSSDYSINYIAKMVEISRQGSPNFRHKIEDPSNIQSFRTAIEEQVRMCLENPDTYWLKN
jgi:hypothetical protein